MSSVGGVLLPNRTVGGFSEPRLGGVDSPSRREVEETRSQRARVARISMPSLSDQELVGLALEGQQAAYAELVRRFERPLFSLVVRMVRDRERAEDLCQEAFVKAFKALDTYDSRRKFSSWLFKIAHNTTIDSMRRMKLDIEPLQNDDEDRSGWDRVLSDEQTPSPHRQAVGSALGDAMERCVLQLRDDYREAFLLRFVQGLAYQEIADVMDLPMGTVKTNLHRARKEFARLLEAEGFGDAAPRR